MGGEQPALTHLTPLAFVLTLPHHFSSLLQTQPFSHAIVVLEPGVYEVAVGLWPPDSALRAELQVDGQTAAVIGGSEGGGTVVGSGRTGRTSALWTPMASGLSDAPKRIEACGLCCLTLLSLHAHATLKLATKRAPGPTKAYMGLRKI